MRISPIVDLVVVAVPPALVPLSLDGIQHVDCVADLALHAQLEYTANYAVQKLQERPDDLIGYGRIHRSVWAITRDPEAVASYPLPHPCAECQDGLDRALAAIAENPDQVVGIGTIWYDAMFKDG